ncbi:MAG: hypothetical protein KGJ36_07925 [Acidobacteriota bacterium]|nr:hypothetical protein [Acidobacteriota bacterium]
MLEGDRETAAALFNRCWELLEDPVRGPEGDAELVTSAFTSRWHWCRIGASREIAVANWMAARALGEVGAHDLAVLFAQGAVEGADAETPDWLSASLAEGVARAKLQRGDPDAHAALAHADALVADIADDDARDLIASQLAETRRRFA